MPMHNHHLGVDPLINLNQLSIACTHQSNHVRYIPLIQISSCKVSIKPLTPRSPNIGLAHSVRRRRPPIPSVLAWTWRRLVCHRRAYRQLAWCYKDQRIQKTSHGHDNNCKPCGLRNRTLLKDKYLLLRDATEKHEEWHYLADKILAILQDKSIVV